VSSDPRPSPTMGRALEAQASKAQGTATISLDHGPVQGLGSHEPPVYRKDLSIKGRTSGTTALKGSTLSGVGGSRQVMLLLRVSRATLRSLPSSPFAC
jgi:hypothetical protein